MAKQLRKLKLKQYKTRRSRAARKKTITENSQWRKWLWSSLALTVLLGSSGVVFISGWISLLFIVNPQSLIWLNEFFPKDAKVVSSQKNITKPLAEIKSNLNQQNLIADEIIPLTNKKQTAKSKINHPNLFLLPIFKQPEDCGSNCQKVLVEVRVYEQAKEIEFKSKSQIHYSLVKSLPVNGLQKFFIESPWDQNVLATDNQEQKVYLPVTEIQTFDSSPSLPGFWFNLRGEYQQEDQTITYGEIIHYNPQIRSLQNMLSWKNAQGKLPHWQLVTGNNNHELVIDQTVGLEPRLQVYQIQSGDLVNNSVFLEEINLQPVIKGSGYEQSLLMARNGLWTSANAWLTSLEKERKKPFPQYVKAQIDFVRLHSQRTKVQANQNWSTASQQVQVALIDGRWEQGLDVLNSSPYNGQEIYNLLQADKGKIWNRAKVALQINPKRWAALSWVYLMFTVQRGEKFANSWLAKQPKISEENLFELQDLSAKLTNKVKNTHSSQIIGGVERIYRINYANWLPTNGEADILIKGNQVLYQVNVSAFQDGTSWLTDPFANLPIPKDPSSLFWRKTLGIGNNSQIQIVVWQPDGEQEVKNATIKAVRMQGKTLKLLVAGDTFLESLDTGSQPKPLAFSRQALQWVQPLPMSIATVEETNPEAIKTALPTIWRSLQQSRDITSRQVPGLPELREKMGDWPVQMIDITKDGNLDLVVTISNFAIAYLNGSSDENFNSIPESEPPRTIIFSHEGKVIYNDFTSKSRQNLTAIARLNSDLSLALLVENSDTYKLRRWSKTNQRLE